MRGFRTVGVLFAFAFALRFWPHPTVSIHFAHWAVPLNLVGFWFVLLLAVILLVRLLIGTSTFYSAHVRRKP